MLDGAGDPLAEPIVAPAPTPPKRPLHGLRLIRAARTSMLSIWSEEVFDRLIVPGEVFGRPYVIVSDPSAVRRVMMENVANYERHVVGYRLSRPMMGKGLLLAAGAPWRRQRRMLSPGFTPAHARRLVPHFAAAGRALVERAQARPERVNLSRSLQHAALQGVFGSLFSLPFEEHGPRLLDLSRRYGAGSGRPNLFDALAQSEDDFAWFTPSREQFKRAWMKHVAQLVAARRAKPRPEGEPEDLLDLMLKAKDPETGENISDEEIRDHSGTMLISGFETTARSMFWLSYLLAHDQREQDRIRAELAADPPDSPDRAIVPSRWPRLYRAMLEALRLYPPIPAMYRQAVHADRLGEVDVVAGASVIVAPWVMHRHRKLWDRPEAFIPERFTGREQEHLSGGAYIPFSTGPRICIGATFALTQATVILSTLLSQFRLELDDDRPVTPLSIITVFPDIEPWFRLTPVRPG